MAAGVAGNSGSSASAKPDYQTQQPEMANFDKPIVGVKAHNQDGVNGFYVYHKSPSDPSFNKVADLSWVSADNWSKVSRTPAFRNFVDHAKGDDFEVQAPMQ